ncbi:carbon-nitrogen hydrolase family protein [Mycolicibacterium sp. CBMA 295]|uniref:carbon-nitrogen hydrolase family protein n=1 Tax=Mycolicibacterium sp. CBMA 295 TaxID=2606605 RepID=UPI0012DD81C3|nr:carbon-nitrogen hydrolase family protein [Mycolicibacterium sp. CBMA 295]MUM28502.1 carbon-nitrogen hydrolase family protein [Mycolicibacterium sp. CBMA 295]
MGDRDLIVRVAAAQASPVWMNREASLEKAIALIDKAGAQGANLIAFGESWLPGFPFWIWLGTPRWGSDYFVRLHQNSVEADGTEISAIGDAARRNNIEVVMGATERDGGSLYCTQFFISSSGSLRGRHRKLKPTHVERTIWGEGDGSDLIVLDTPVGRVGGLNCWEHLQFVLAVTSVVDDSVIEELCTTEEQRRLLKRGGGTTTIFGPNGATIAGPLGADEEGLLIADLDLSEIRRAKQAADPTGHYARADATRLLLNPQPRNPVERDQSKATEFVTTEELSVPAPNEFDS